MNNFYAHSIEGKPKSEWQGLEEHLEGTAELAKNLLIGIGLRTGQGFGMVEVES